jgi:hypothetical protein
MRACSLLRLFFADMSKEPVNRPAIEAKAYRRITSP